MIAKLTGTLDSRGDDWAVVDVNGVGYLTFCSARTLADLPPPGSPVSLTVETHVREDHIHLYGFLGTEERDCFRLLMTIQGVGAKVALALLGALRPAEVLAAIRNQDAAPLTRAPGVGPRLARRLLTELRDKVGTLPAGEVVGFALPRGGAPDAKSDAISALVNLGFRQGDAFGVVSAAARRMGPDAGLEDLVKAGLKELSA